MLKEFDGIEWVTSFSRFPCSKMTLTMDLFLKEIIVYKEFPWNLRAKDVIPYERCVLKKHFRFLGISWYKDYCVCIGFDNALEKINGKKYKSEIVSC